MDLEGKADGGTNGSPAQHPERRRESRHPVDTNAVIYLIDLAAKVQGRILDVSLHGCCIHTHQRFPLGIFRRVETEFSFEGLPFRLGGVTQALYDPRTVGIRFLDMSERKREQLVQLIEEVDELQKREKAAAALNGSPLREPADERSPNAS